MDTTKYLTALELSDPADHEFLVNAVANWWQSQEDENGGHDYYEYADNFRYAVKGDEGQMMTYEAVQRHGCCGFHDDEFGPAPSGKTYLYGFNYGH